MAPSIAPIRVPDPRRLGPEDARLLDLEERRERPLHVGSVLVFDGAPPELAALGEHVTRRLELLPRHRDRVVRVPLGAGRPLWVEDRDLSLRAHLRREALPAPADDAALADVASRALSQRLDRSLPLWEITLVEGLRPQRFALIVKSHAVLSRDARGPDLAAALLDESPAPPAPRDPGAPPGAAAMLAGALAERASSPREALETLRAATSRLREELDRHGLDPLSGIGAAPASPLNGPTGPHRAIAWTEVDLDALRTAKERLRGTINDIVLTAVAGALGGHLRAAGVDVRGLALRALVPVLDPSGERLLAAYAPLPVGLEDGRRRHADISRALDGLRASGRATAADELATLAPTSLIAAAARLPVSARSSNLIVANAPGPRAARHLLGRPLRSIVPALPLADGHALSIGVIAHAGRLSVGVLVDPERFGTPESLAALLAASFAELAPAEAR